MVAAVLKRKRNAAGDAPSNKVRVSVTIGEIIADIMSTRKDKDPANGTGARKRTLLPNLPSRSSP